jgi:hypothetical protein
MEISRLIIQQFDISLSYVGKTHTMNTQFLHDACPVYMMHARFSISSPELLNKPYQNLMFVIYNKSCQKILIFYILFQYRKLCVLVSVATRQQVEWPGFDCQ